MPALAARCHGATLSAMSWNVDRRGFLSSSLVGLGAAAALRGQPARGREPAAARFKWSLAQWSLHRRFRGQQQPRIDPLHFAATAHRLGFTGVEYVNQFFADKARDRAYLDELARRAEDVGVQSVLIMCDGEGALGDPDEAARARAIQNHHKWVDAARHLGCHSIRVNAHSSGSTEEQMKLAADGLRRLTEYADGQEINVLVENHGGLSSDGAWLAGVMRRVEHPRCGTLPDFGNFRIGKDREYDRYRGVAELMPFAKAVSAKSHDFDADGNEVHTDYRKMMKIVTDAGYTGWVGVEYEGGGLTEEQGIVATLRLLQRVTDQAD